MLAPRFTGVSQELFLAAGVDVRNGLLDVVEVARGSVASVEVHPREVFRPLIRMAAAGAVLVHNHPSGDPTPSREDVEPHPADARRSAASLGSRSSITSSSAIASSVRSASGWARPSTATDAAAARPR